MAALTKPLFEIMIFTHQYINAMTYYIVFYVIRMIYFRKYIIHYFSLVRLNMICFAPKYQCHDIWYRFYVIRMIYLRKYIIHMTRIFFMLDSIYHMYDIYPKNISYVWHVFFSCQSSDFLLNLNMTYAMPIYQPHDICHGHISYYLIYCMSYVTPS